MSKYQHLDSNGKEHKYSVIWQAQRAIVLLVIVQKKEEMMSQWKMII